MKGAEQAANLASQSAQTMNTGTHKLNVVGRPLVVTPVLQIRYHSRARIAFYRTAIAWLGTSLKEILVAPSAVWARTENMHKTHRLVCHAPRIRPPTLQLPPADRIVYAPKTFADKTPLMACRVSRVSQRKENTQRPSTAAHAKVFWRTQPKQ